MIERALVFAGGDFNVASLAKLTIESDDYILCIDGGLAACDAAGLQAHCLLGDEDSVSPEILARQEPELAERIRFSSDKNASDLELGFRHLADRQCRQAVVFGMSGGRTDHMLFNWFLCTQSWPFKLRLLDATSDAYVMQGAFSSLCVSDVAGATVSLLALTTVTGVTTDGLVYALADATLTPGSTLGLSNRAQADAVKVFIESGSMIVLFT